MMRGLFGLSSTMGASATAPKLLLPVTRWPAASPPAALPPVTCRCADMFQKPTGRTLRGDRRPLHGIAISAASTAGL